MSTDEYVPSDKEVREEYVYGVQEVDMDGCVVVSFDEACARWDRFLARVRRDAAREALDGAGHRIARLEAQSAIRGRAVVMYRERAREAETGVENWRKQYEQDTDYWANATDAAEARIKAVRGVHTGTVWPGVADKPICDACDQMWPCPTIRALDN